MSQHHHKQNYMWLNVCDLTEKILLAKKTSKEVDFSDFIRTFVPSFCALLFYNAALRLGEIAGVAVSGVFTTLERVKFKYSVAILK